MMEVNRSANCCRMMPPMGGLIGLAGPVPMGEDRLLYHHV
jgi:hypothetical protein